MGEKERNGSPYKLSRGQTPNLDDAGLLDIQVNPGTGNRYLEADHRNESNSKDNSQSARDWGNRFGISVNNSEL
jgi:hypothetical protein